jgi:hypothetical protein
VELLEGIAVSDRWGLDPETNLWKCGDLVIALEAIDPTRFYVKVAASAGGKRLFGGYVHPSGYQLDEFGWFTAIFASAAEGEPVPTAGLETWFERAQELADAEYEYIRHEREEALEALPGRTAAELMAQTTTATDWLIPGFVKRGWVTKVGGREKQAGKGTLITHLLGKLERGEETVFGPAAAAPISALIFSEEPDDSMREKVAASGLARARIVFGWEFGDKSWSQKVQTLVELTVLEGHGIVFVDNTSRAARITDEGGTEFARAVETLIDACRAAGLTLIIDVHHKKGRDSIENKTRGGTGVQGAVDINVEVERVGARSSRRRKLTAFGRVQATHWEKVIELSEDGTEYTLANDEPETVDVETQTAFTDAVKLRDCTEPITAEAFGEMIGVKKGQAINRLRVLEDNGVAIKHPGSGPHPATYEAVEKRAITDDL